MMRGGWILLLTLVSLVCLMAAQPVGYFLTWAHTESPLNTRQDCAFTYHLMNNCNAPLLLEIGPGAVQPMFVLINALPEDYDPDAAQDVWGPPLGLPLLADKTKVHVSGCPDVDASRGWPSWPDRAGIVLFRNEGYARRISLDAGWLTEEQLKAIQHDWLVVHAAPQMKVHLPRKDGDAVMPGQLVRFASGAQVYAPGDRLVPFTKRPGLAVPQRVYGDTKQVLSMHIEFPQPLAVGEDLVCVYLIGNTSKQTVYIEQNSMIPAHVAMTVVQRTRELVHVDASSEESMRFLLPAREPLALNPGEYLSWKHVLTAGDLSIRSPGNYALQMQLDTAWRAGLDAEPQAISLKAEHSFRVDRK